MKIRFEKTIVVVVGKSEVYAICVDSLVMWHFNMKMKLFITLIIIIIIFTCVSCRYSYIIEKRNNRYVLTRDFKNQGELEDYWTRSVFKKEYKKMSFNPYNGEILVSRTEDAIEIRFDSALIKISYRDSLYSCLFTSRLIHPRNIGCSSLSGHGILIQELYNLETRHKKRFSLWVWQPNCMNPQVVLLEITNKKINKNKKLCEFVNGAELTFVYMGWIII